MAILKKLHAFLKSKLTFFECLGNTFVYPFIYYKCVIPQDKSHNFHNVFNAKKGVTSKVGGRIMFTLLNSGENTYRPLLLALGQNYVHQ